jgi:hypothetical protein
MISHFVRLELFSPRGADPGVQPGAAGGRRRTKTSRKRPKGWTPERRTRQSRLIRRWQPWRHSTGPRTDLGKARCAMNPLSHRGLSDAALLELRHARQLLRFAAHNLRTFRAVLRARNSKSHLPLVGRACPPPTGVRSILRGACPPPTLLRGFIQGCSPPGPRETRPEGRVRESWGRSVPAQPRRT